MYRHNFHTHTAYCDGSAPPREYIIAALDAGLESIGFSGHAPVPFPNGFAISGHESLLEYCAKINNLKSEFADRINIYLGLEADFIPGYTEDFDVLKAKYGLDYIIGSVHLVMSDNGSRWFIDGPDRDIWKKGLEQDFNGDIRSAVTAYYHQINNMVENQDLDVVGHFDKIKMHNRGEYFSEDESWYWKLIKESLEIIKANGCIVEVNTRGLYKNRTDDFFPGSFILREMYKMNIPVCINSDAHKPGDTALLLEDAARALQKANYKEVYIYSADGWKPIPLN